MHRLAVAPDLPVVRGDPIQLQQVIINLALNAAQAMEHSPVRHLLIRTSAVGADQVQLVLEDTGPGIDDAHAESLFDSFFTTKPSGMGIGLGVCRSIIEAHDGTISVCNRADRGAVASIVLPLARFSDVNARAAPDLLGSQSW